VFGQEIVMKFAGLLLGLLAATALPLGADQRLAVEVPSVMLAPGHLVVQTQIEPDPANRAIQVTAESSGFYRSSEILLDGDAAPRRNSFEFKDLPPGSYDLHVTLLDSKGEPRASVVRTLQVRSHV
jgi:hypothetical protein